MDFGSALMALAISLGVKLAVLVVGARLLLRLYRARVPLGGGRLWLHLPESDAPEVRLLWWSLVLFYASELTCGVEVYVLFRSNVYLSSFHGLVSAAGMGLFALAVYFFLDARVFRFGAKGCALNARVCRGCTLSSPEGCRFTTLLMFLGTLAALAAIYPWFAPTEKLVADPTRYILPFDSLNAWYDHTVVPWLTANIDGYDPTGEAYHIPSIVLAVEYRVVPAIGLAAAITSLVLLRRGRLRPGVKALVFAVGLLCYPYFELILYATTDDVILGSLGHEVAELWFLMATAEWLRRAYPPGAT